MERLSRAAPLALACLLAAVMAAPLRADTLYIGRPQPWLRGQDTFVPGQDFATAADAMAVASDGDRVIVLVDIEEPFTIDKRIALLGYGNKARPFVKAPVTVTAAGVEIDNLHFRTLSGTAVTLLDADDVTIQRCFFTECQNAITMHDTERGRFTENRMLFSGAVHVFGGGDNLFRGNQIDSGSIYAVRFAASSGNRFLENHVRRSGWVGLVLYAKSTHNQIIGNIFEGNDIGLSIQTDDNVVADNLFFDMRRGVALTRSPFGKDGSVYDKIVYEDSDTGDTRVVIRGNRIEGNTFRGCRREAMVLKQAQDNQLSSNVITGEAARGIVLMDEADGNVVTDTLFGPDIGEAVRIVRSTGNVVRGPDGSGVVRLLEAPGNTIEGPRQEAVDVGNQRALQRAPGSDLLLAFGDFHTHSLLSDGSSTPDELLGYARDVAGLDFVAMSDHGEYIGHGDGRWEALNEAVERFSIPGRFVAIPGYETTFVIGWSTHCNVYFSGPRGKAYMAPHGGRTWIPNLVTPTPTRLLKQLAEDEEDALVIRHHYFATPDFWAESPADSDMLPMTELCSVHAIWTGQRDVDAYASDRSAEIRGHVATLMGALRAGRVLGVGGSSDSHYSFPGDSGLTGVMTEALDAASIFEALRARRSYATTGARIRLGFSVDGQPMGSILTGNGTPSGVAIVEGTADLEEVVIFENERELLRVEPDGRTARVEFTADGPPPDGTWYMVRVTQADGEMAWSTPVWVRPKDPEVASPEVLADRERMALLAYGAVLRAWPDLPTKDLAGLSPKEARVSPDPAVVAAFDEAWERYLRTVGDLERQAAEIGLDNPVQAQAIIKKYALRFGPLPPPIRIKPRLDPIVDLDAVRERLGM